MCSQCPLKGNPWAPTPVHSIATSRNSRGAFGLGASASQATTVSNRRHDNSASLSIVSPGPAQYGQFPSRPTLVSRTLAREIDDSTIQLGEHLRVCKSRLSPHGRVWRKELVCEDRERNFAAAMVAALLDLRRAPPRAMERWINAWRSATATRYSFRSEEIPTAPTSDGCISHYHCGMHRTKSQNYMPEPSSAYQNVVNNESIYTRSDRTEVEKFLVLPHLHEWITHIRSM